MGKFPEPSEPAVSSRCGLCSGLLPSCGMPRAPLTLFVACTALMASACSINRVRPLASKPIVSILPRTTILLSVDSSQEGDSKELVGGTLFWKTLRLEHIRRDGHQVGGGCFIWDHADIWLPNQSLGLRYYSFQVPAGLYSSGADLPAQAATGEILTIQPNRVNYVGRYTVVGHATTRTRQGIPAAREWAAIHFGGNFVDASGAELVNGISPFPLPFLCTP
jgi:hypothetical protein